MVAIDAGNPPLNSTLSVTITVEDINEKPPVFDEDTFVPLEVIEDAGGVGSGIFLFIIIINSSRIPNIGVITSFE